MYNFDTERKKRHEDREREFGEKPFQFGGEVFYVKANVRYAAIKRVAEITENTGGVEVFEAVEEAVLALLDSRDNAYDRFRALCRKDEDPVTFEDLAELQGWLIREATARPPTQPDSSSTGQSTAGTTSTEPSSTEPAPVSTT